MEYLIWVETRLGGCILERHQVATVERTTSEIAPEAFGLSLEEGKSLVQQVQARIVQTQTDVVAASGRTCSLCNRKQRVKDVRSRSVRTVFGRIAVTCRRYIRRRCQGEHRRSLWPLSRHRLLGTTPELQYLYATWGSKLLYRKAAALLKDLLPVSTEEVSHATDLQRSRRIRNEPCDQPTDGKRQPMCWSAEGAHLLLQVRCAVLDNRLDTLFGKSTRSFVDQPPFLHNL
jgi:hypothetical protein